MIATTETIKDLEQAVRQFGAYQLEDKGAVEVMDVDAITERLRKAGVQTAVETLRALTEHEHGDTLVRYLIMVFVEDEPGWDELVDALEADPVLHRTYIPWIGDAPDCTKCGASNAGSREAPFQCDVCQPELESDRIARNYTPELNAKLDASEAAMARAREVGGRPLSEWGIPGITDDEIARVNAALED